MIVETRNGSNGAIFVKWKIPVLNTFKPHRKPHRTANNFSNRNWTTKNPRIAEKIKVLLITIFRVAFDGLLRHRKPHRKIFFKSQPHREPLPNRGLRFAVRCGWKMFNTGKIPTDDRRMHKSNNYNLTSIKKYYLKCVFSLKTNACSWQWSCNTRHGWGIAGHLA
jgi:hypothetical protein